MCPTKGLKHEQVSRWESVGLGCRGLRSSLWWSGPQQKQQDQSSLCRSQTGSYGTWDSWPGGKRQWELLIMETGNSYSVIDSFAGNRSMLEHWSLPHWRKGKKRGKESRTQYGENPGEGMVYGPLDGSADTSQPGPQRASSLENISSVMARTLVVFSSDDFPALAWYLAHSTCSVNNLLQGEWVKEECN